MKIHSEDHRKKQIVFLSRCILNQNLRFPGIAIKSGAVNEIIEPLLSKGLGIEQLPCLECLGWKGVARKSFFKYIPKFFKYSESKIFPILKLFGAIWIWKYRRLCKKETKFLLDQIQDFINSGYLIVGIIAMNDSPTCGLTKTINLLSSAKEFKNIGLKLSDFLNPKFEKMKFIIPNLLDNGTGIFMGEIIKEMKNRKLDIKLIDFNPWNDLKEEADKIIKMLALKNVE